MDSIAALSISDTLHNCITILSIMLQWVSHFFDNILSVITLSVIAVSVEAPSKFKKYKLFFMLLLYKLECFYLHYQSTSTEIYGTSIPTNPTHYPSVEGPYLASRIKKFLCKSWFYGISCSFCIYNISITLHRSLWNLYTNQPQQIKWELCPT